MGLLATLPRATTADRRHIVGASDIAAILGVSPWASPMSVWLRMVGEAEPDDGHGAEAKARGNHFESGVRSWTAERIGALEVEAGIPIDEPGVVGSEPWTAYHPDGAFLLPSGWAIAELKTSRHPDGWGESGSAEIPAHYALQMAWQLALTPQVERLVAGVYVTSWDELRTYTVEREVEVERWLLDEVGSWYWRHIARGDAPPIDGSASSKSFLSRRFPRGNGLRVEADPEQRALALNWRAAKDRARVAEAEADHCANLLRETLGDASDMQTPEGRVSLIDVRGATSLDAAALREAHPEIARAFERQGAARRDLRWTPASRRKGG